MKIFSSAQIKNWDAFTIKNEPVASIDLMERAATACVDWILKHYPSSSHFKIFCGKGNNGGDGMAIARLLLQKNYSAAVYVVESGSPGSPDFEENVERLHSTGAPISLLKKEDDFPVIEANTILVDALFGTGLNKKLTGIFSAVVGHLNTSGAEIIAVDIPSGMFTDKSSLENPMICATHTLSFQQYKLAFLMAENAPWFGRITILDIHLSQEFYKEEQAVFELTGPGQVHQIYVPRRPFTNKGNFGYACLVAGSYGMMGAAVLSAKACLRSGVGKLTCYICSEGYSIMQTAVPEAMCMVFGKSFVKDIDGLKNFDAMGIGPGIGRHLSHKELLQKVFKNGQIPMVIDADALNILSNYNSLLKSIPAYSIITPHPKEFDRLFGKCKNDFERALVALKKAKELNIFIVLKGHRTLIASPNGKGYFNTTGNAGMATAGSGDVLTGILTALVAQGYTPLDAAVLGVYLHGLAGDKAAASHSQEAMVAGDIIDHLGKAFLEISHDE
ncbi:MAG TPA: NAD(P)H-hydrate dehydratase [Chitinophagaceae bacterium]|nr:NAD(P)H-hydrate dehydratase [Chitinophagaceae bacterium]